MSDGRPRRCPTTPLAVGIFLALLLAAPRVGSAAPAPPDSLRETQACLECHQDKAAALATTPHRLPDGAAGRIACTSCHAGDRRHWEDDPQTHPMTDPSRIGARAEAALCAPCHRTSHQQTMSERNAHASADVACSGCHSVHAAKGPTLLRKAESGLCTDCHVSVAPQFARPYHHPVSEGIVRCSECHRTLDETRRPLSANGTNVCVRCHGEFQGPFRFEHPAALDYSTEEGGCVSCHEPHGSSLPRMLKLPYEGPRFQLCTQCHSVPRHQSNVMHGTQWAGVPCNDCHTDIHGSNESRLFLSESLRGQGCFNVGCHKF